MSQFNPATAYATDWQYFDDIEDATFFRADGEYIGRPEPATGQAVKVREQSIDSQDYRLLSQIVALQPSDMAVFLWETGGDGGTITKIRPEDIIEFGGERWKVLTARKSIRSYWSIAMRLTRPADA